MDSSRHSFVCLLSIFGGYLIYHYYCLLYLSTCLCVCSSSEWNEIDPSEREDLHLKMEDGEFW